MPNRTSLPSMLPPGFAGGRDDVHAARRVDRVAARLGPVGRGHAGEEQHEHRGPERPAVALVPHHPAEQVGRAPTGSAKIANIDQKFVHGVGFSNGWAALALKKPPPLVPSCLMASWLATGPMAIVCFAPSSVVTSRYGSKFWITPCCDQDQRDDAARAGSRT